MAEKIDNTGNAVIDNIKMKQQVSHPSSPASGYELLYIVSGSAHGGLFVKDSAGRQIGPFITGSSSAAGISWTQVVDESGSSFANFTAAAGTWASDGTWIKQTDTANSHRRAKYNTKVLNSGIVFECNIQPRSTGTDKLGGLVVGFDGTNGSGIRVHIKCGQSVWAVQEDGVSEIATFTAGATVNTTYNMRIVVFGGAVTVYQDGSIIGSARVAKSVSASFIGLASYGAEYWWKDIKAWVLSLPS